MPSIKINFFYSSIITSANFIFPLITFPYVSRVLGVTSIGIVNFVDSIIYYFILVSMMGMSVVGIREIAKCRNNRQELDKTFSSLFLLNTMTTFLALILLLVASIAIAQLREHWQMMIVGALKLVVNYLLIDWFFKGLENFRFITICTLIIRMVYVVSVLLFVRNQADYVLYYLLTVLAIAVNAMINILYSRKFVSYQFYRVNPFIFLNSFFILGIYYLLTSMYTSFNIAYLGFVCGETEVGYYATATKIHKIIIAVFTAFTSVMLPRMSSLLSEQKKEEFKYLTSKAYTILISFSVPVIMFVIVYTPIIINVIAGDGYEGAITPMRIVMPLLMIIGYEQILVIQTLMPLQRDDIILKNSIVGAAVGVALNVMLVSRFASVGSSLVWFISEIVVLCCAQYYVTKIVGFTFPWKLMVKTLFSNVPLGVLLLLVFYYVPSRYFSMILSMIIVPVYFVINSIICRDKELVPIITSVIKVFNKNK